MFPGVLEISIMLVIVFGLYLFGKKFGWWHMILFFIVISTVGSFLGTL